MFDRYDPRSDERRDRGDSWDRSFGSRGSAGERDRDVHSRDVFTRDLDLPQGRDREQVRDRERVYEISGPESRTLATIGAFRVVAETDLHDIRDDSQSSRRSLKHLEKEGLIHTSPLSSDDRAVTLTDRGRDLLEANRYERHDRTHEPRQTFHAGIRKPRELTHDTNVYRAHQRRAGSVICRVAERAASGCGGAGRVRHARLRRRRPQRPFNWKQKYGGATVPAVHRRLARHGPDGADGAAMDPFAEAGAGVAWLARGERAPATLPA